MPHLVVTAGNDQHLRIWDVRHMSKIQPRAVDRLTPPPEVKGEGEDVKPHFDTHPTSMARVARLLTGIHGAEGFSLRATTTSCEVGSGCLLRRHVAVTLLLPLRFFLLSHFLLLPLDFSVLPLPLFCLFPYPACASCATSSSTLCTRTGRASSVHRLVESS